MGFYTTTIECVICNEGFEASRIDAETCSGKCRGKKHRREKKRAQAKEQLEADWKEETMADYMAIIEIQPEMESRYLDMIAEHGAKETAVSIQLLAEFYREQTFVHQRIIDQKDLQIERLKQEKELLN